MEGHYDRVDQLAFQADGRRLLAADDLGSIRLWDVETGRCLSCWDVGTGGNAGAVVCRDERRFLDPRGGDVRVWDIERRELLGALPVEDSWRPTGPKAAFSHDGRALLLVCQDGTVRRWACR